MSYYSNGQSGLTILANSAAGQGTAQSLLYGRRKNRHGGRRVVTTRKNRKASRKGSRKASRKNRKTSRKNRKASRKNRKASRKNRKESRRNRH